jgi:serine/threonine protein kinase
MELCERGALRERICDGLSWTLLVRLALDVANGLSFLHQQHIVHRFVGILMRHCMLGDTYYCQ